MWVNYVRRHLESIITEAGIDTLLTDTKSPGGSPTAVQKAFCVICSDAYIPQMLAPLDFASAQVIRRPFFGDRRLIV